MIPVLLAAPGLGQEPDIVVAAPTRGVTVVRRCVDTVELLAAAAADPQARIVVSATLPRLSGDAVERMGGATRVVGLCDSEVDERRLHDLGVGSVVQAADSAAVTVQRLAAACGPGPAGPGGVWATTPSAAEPGEPGSGSAGRVVAVWGPMGSPGRTTVALGLAEALAERGQRVCTVDADTYAPSMAMTLGVVEDTSGLLVACRQAESGVLTDGRLTALTRRVSDCWHLLGGLSSTERWPELRAGALDRVWAACREEFDVTVIDIGFCLEPDDTGAWARQRNAAALTALAAADHVVAVADASAAGLARLAAAWPALESAAPGASTLVVRNRGTHRDREWSRAAAACGVRAPVHEVPADPRRVDRSRARGLTLREGARRSPVRGALAEVARSALAG